MPNTGRPSQDCHLCRSRRVKCDLGRPSCQRCIKYGAECPGYRDQQELMFRNADPTRNKNRKNRLPLYKGQEASASSPSSAAGSTIEFLVSSTPAVILSDSGSVETSSGSEVALSSKAFPYALAQPPLLSPIIHEHWTMHSIPIVLNVWGPVEFLGDMYGAYPPDGPLVWAAHLFSRTYVTNLRYPTAMSKESYDETQKELRMYLGKTLGAVGTALMSPDGAKRDDVLATVWILANYELLVGVLDRPYMTSPWQTHARGLYGILKTRGVGNLTSPTSRAAFWSAFTLIQIDCLAGTRPCPAETTEWFKVIESSMYPDERIPIIVADFINKVTTLQHTMMNIIRRSDYEAASHEYHALVGRMVEAENQVDIGFSRFNKLDSMLYSFWNQLYCSAIVTSYHIAQLYINLLSHYRPCPIPMSELEARRDYFIQRVRGAAQEIIDSATNTLRPLIHENDTSPKMLFDSMMVIWPITSVYTVPLTLPEQKSAAEMALLFLGKSLGIKQALSAVPGLSGARVPLHAQAPHGFGECEMADWVGRLK